MARQKMTVAEARAISAHDRAWAAARNLQPEIQALAGGELSPFEAPELCQFLACLVSGDLNMPHPPPAPPERIQP